MARGPILAAGGIVVRGGGPELRIAVVQMRKREHWVLPKGKLDDGEDALAAARREVLEETGHRVYVHEFLGTMSYEVGSGPKIVQFWRMQAVGETVGELGRDIKAVDWLPLADAIERLSYDRERVFLRHVGPLALQAAERTPRRSTPPARETRTRRVAPPRRAEAEVAVLAPVTAEEMLAMVPVSMSTVEPPPMHAAPIQASEPAVRPKSQNLVERALVWLRPKRRAAR